MFDAPEVLNTSAVLGASKITTRGYAELSSSLAARTWPSLVSLRGFAATVLHTSAVGGRPLTFAPCHEVRAVWPLRRFTGGGSFFLGQGGQGNCKKELFAHPSRRATK